MTIEELNNALTRVVQRVIALENKTQNENNSNMLLDHIKDLQNRIKILEEARQKQIKLNEELLVKKPRFSWFK